MGERKESLINPEEIWGSEVRVPIIVGQGSGLGFEFKNLSLPTNWEVAIPKLKELDHSIFAGFFSDHCQERGYEAGDMKYDPSTGILTQITVNTQPVSSLRLSEFSFEREKGIYVAENVNDIKVAIILQSIAARFLNYVAMDSQIEDRYPYLDGNQEGYYPLNLSIPDKFINAQEPLTNSYYQRHFEIEASNIAGRFGLTLGSITFDDRGVLSHVDITVGSCGYDLNRGREYLPHNVDSPYQGAALQGITASFINFLLEKP